jgi:hypothetical protein
MPTDELVSTSATVLAQAIRERRLSLEQVVTAYFTRLEAVIPR